MKTLTISNVFTILSLFCCFTILTDLAEAAENKKPNVVLILVDDMGWMDLSCQGSDYYKTPHIDKLAAEGMRFTDAYAACSVCSPTRAAVMTGRLPGRIGVTDWIRARFQRGDIGTPEANPTEYVGGKKQKLLCPPNPYWLEHEEITVAELLQHEGYKTCHIGKWHLGDPDWYPLSQGFDINIGGCDLGQPPSYFDPYSHPRYSFEESFKPRKKDEFLTHREGDEAKQFIRANKENSFFLSYCPYAVHTPIQAIDEVAAKYRKEGKKEIQAKYAALVESVDDAVGMIVDELQSQKLLDNTLIIFTSDNGGLKGPTDNTPLRSGKGYAYEGGIRVPFIARWPGVVPAGTVSHEPIMSIDLLPTICEAVGVSVPDDRAIDGVSLLPLFKNESHQLEDDRVLTWHFPHYRHAPGPYSIIRDGDWKLIQWYEGKKELYNLADDLSESKDLSSEHQEQLVKLEQKLARELKQQGAKLPKLNPEYDPPTK
ncbi:sulfatase [Thalassoglobus sp.]|uniref:sulfatase n=1 Tax=Thalassoglobus sp. TaxID=2795869 RepID=UPI003AA9CE12